MNEMFNFWKFAAISFVAAWLFCQVFKIIMNLAVMGHLSFKDFARSLKYICQDGSFPSAHSSVVTVGVGVVLWLCMQYPHPVTGGVFVIAVLFASVVIRDAVGTRYKNQVNSNAIKAILKLMKIETGEVVAERYEQKKLDAKSGHQKHEVAGGVLCGAMGTLCVHAFCHGQYRCLWLMIPLALAFAGFAIYHYLCSKQG